MRIFVEAGHGQDYRKRGEYDIGWLDDRRNQEATICWEYDLRLVAALRSSGYSAIGYKVGPIAERLKRAFKYDSELVVSLHLGMDPSGAKGGRVLYATEGSVEIADALGSALGFTVEKVGLAGMLMFNPSVEIELGNIVCWDDMKRLGCEAAAQELFSRLADALTGLGL